MTSPFDQSRYQVRLEWGVAGLERVAASDVVVVVDVLRFSSTVVARLEVGEATPLDAAAHAVSLNGAAAAVRAAELSPAVILGCLRNASAVADRILDLQLERGERTSIAVIAAGELTSRDGDAPLRFAVEDLLGAGAVIDALANVGIDHSSPEAAAACEAFRGLRGALRHMLTASGSGQEMLARGLVDAVRDAAALDTTGAVPRLRNGAFVAS